MKKWYLWLVLGLIFAIGGVINFFDGRSILGQVIQVSITVLLAFIQFLCDRKGEKGKKVFNYIGITLSITLVIWIIVLILKTFI